MERGTQEFPDMPESFADLASEKAEEFRRLFDTRIKYTPEMLQGWFNNQYLEQVVPYARMLNQELIGLVLDKSSLDMNYPFVDLWLKGPEMCTHSNNVATELSAFNVRLFHAHEKGKLDNAHQELRKLRSYIEYSNDDNDIRQRMEQVYLQNNFAVAVAEYEYSPTPPLPTLGKKRNEFVRFSDGRFGIDQRALRRVAYPGLLVSDELDDVCFSLDWWDSHESDEAYSDAVQDSFFMLADHYAVARKQLEWAKIMRRSSFAELLTVESVEITH